MDGKIHKINGFNSYEVFHAEQDQIFVFADILEKQLGFSMETSPVIGLDGIYWNSKKQGIKLEVGWDNWSGAFVMSFCSRGSDYVEKLATICEGML